MKCEINQQKTVDLPEKNNELYYLNWPRTFQHTLCCVQIVFLIFKYIWMSAVLKWTKRERHSVQLAVALWTCGMERNFLGKHYCLSTSFIFLVLVTVNFEPIYFFRFKCVTCTFWTYSIMPWRCRMHVFNLACDLPFAIVWTCSSSCSGWGVIYLRLISNMIVFTLWNWRLATAITVITIDR